MTTPSTSLPTTLVRGRIAALQAWLTAHDLDDYAVTGTENTRYLRGWTPDVEPWGRPIVLIVPRRGEPLLVAHELSVHGFRMARERGTMVVDDVTFYAERPSPAGGGWCRGDWGALVAGRLAALGLPAGARVACDARTAPIEEVAPHAGGMRFTPAPQEVALMRAAASLTGFGQVVFRDLARPGALMADVDAETVRRMRVEGARRLPGSDVTARCFSLTGPASAAPHGTGADADARILGAQAAAVVARVPGAPIAGIDRAALAAIERHGFSSHVFHRTGHGIGLHGHDLPDDMAFNERPLRAGEVYAIEPGLYPWGLGGFRIDDTVVVGDPPLVLTRTPRGLGDVTLAA